MGLVSSPHGARIASLDLTHLLPIHDPFLRFNPGRAGSPPAADGSPSRRAPPRLTFPTSKGVSAVTVPSESRNPITTKAALAEPPMPTAVTAPGPRRCPTQEATSSRAVPAAPDRSSAARTRAASWPSVSGPPIQAVGGARPLGALCAAGEVLPAARNPVLVVLRQAGTNVDGAL